MGYIQHFRSYSRLALFLYGMELMGGSLKNLAYGVEEFTKMYEEYKAKYYIA